MKNIIYIADIDQDIDDMVAIDYLASQVKLTGVVLDPMPVSDLGKERVEAVRKMGIDVFDNIPDNTEIVFSGGGMSKLASYLVDHKIEMLVMNGGFVGTPIVPPGRGLPKFDGKAAIRTYNFNCNVEATDAVLKSENIGQTVLVGKNVCHDERNTFEIIWKAEKNLQTKYGIRAGKKMHDLLAIYEGLAFLDVTGCEHLCRFEYVYPYNDGLEGNMTRWGSSREPTCYKKVLAAITWL